MDDQKRKPLYYQIKQYLYGLIYENRNEKNFLLPSENSLCKTFNVSRITAKRALEDLVSEGFAKRKQGMGTILVNSPEIQTLEKYNKTSTIEQSIGEIIKTKKTVALILPDLQSKYYLSILDGIQSYATKADWQVLLAISQYDQETEANLIKKLIYTVDGMIISPVNNRTYNREILRLSMHNFPLVLIDNILSGLDTNTVASDNAKAAYEATEYFIKKGKKNIGLITQPIQEIITLKERYRGYETCLFDHNIPIDKNYILPSLHHYDKDADSKIKKFLSDNNKLDALIALNYETGIKTINTILSVNTHITTNDIIIFDEEFQDIYNLLKIKINYIKQNSFEIGKTAFDIICEQEKTGNYLHRQIRIPASLIIGN